MYCEVMHHIHRKECLAEVCVLCQRVNHLQILFLLHERQIEQLSMGHKTRTGYSTTMSETADSTQSALYRWSHRHCILTTVSHSSLQFSNCWCNKLCTCSTLQWRQLHKVLPCNDRPHTYCSVLKIHFISKNNKWKIFWIPRRCLY